MLNILPKQQKIILKKEYNFRRIVIWLALVSASLVVSLILLVPSFLVYRVKAIDAKAGLERSKQAIDADLQTGAASAEIAKAIKNVPDLKPFVAPKSVYALFKIFENKPKTIKIFEISYLNRGIDTPTILVSGVALDRESLTTFATSLEARPEFSAIDLPVSNFAKERDINFSMTISVK